MTPLLPSVSVHVYDSVNVFVRIRSPCTLPSSYSELLGLSYVSSRTVPTQIVNRIGRYPFALLARMYAGVRKARSILQNASCQCCSSRACRFAAR